MNQFVRVLLLGLWLMGSLVMGLDAPLSEPTFRDATVEEDTPARLVDLSVGTNEIVVTVGPSASSQWRVAVPVPPLVTAWVRHILQNPVPTPASNAATVACTPPAHTLLTPVRS